MITRACRAREHPVGLRRGYHRVRRWEQLPDQRPTGAGGLRGAVAGPGLTGVDVQQPAQQPGHRAHARGGGEAAAFQLEELGVVDRFEAVPQPFGLAQQRRDLLVGAGGQIETLQGVDRSVRGGERDLGVELLQRLAHVFYSTVVGTDRQG